MDGTEHQQQRSLHPAPRRRGSRRPQLLPETRGMDGANVSRGDSRAEKKVFRTCGDEGGLYEKETEPGGDRMV